MPGTPDIDALKALVAHNQYWSDWSTIAVFVALLLEIIIIFAFSKDKPRSETILSFICGLMLSVGVYGEYRFGSRAARGSAELQNISDQKWPNLTDKLTR
jgi:ABC-type Mn2+/Zn2+ transport system permease subunit